MVQFEHLNKFDAIILLLGITVLIHFIFLHFHFPIALLLGPLILRAFSYHSGIKVISRRIVKIVFVVTCVLSVFRLYLYFSGVHVGESLFRSYYLLGMLLMIPTLLICPLRMIFFFQKRHFENSKRINLLNQLASLCILMGLTCVFLYSDILYDLELEKPVNNIYYVFLIVAFILISIYLWSVIRNPVEEVHVPLLAPSYSVEEQSKVEQKLATAMLQDKLYLKADFSLDMLADHTGLAKYRLSEHFREYHGTTFYEYVAEYRINQAIQMMDKGGFNYTMEALANSIGFNSVTTFNKYFKEYVGCTPSEYRERIVK